MRIDEQLALGLFVAVLASSPVNAAPPIGTTVQVTTTVSASGRTLQKSSPIFFNDVVKSNATGVGQFVFDDGSKLAMGPSATVTIDKSIFKGKSAQRTGIQASKGAFRYISGAFSGHSLSTPYGTIGIRGTAFDFTIRNGRVYVLLFKGSVSFCGAGGCQTLKRSCDYLVGGGGKVSSPQALSAGVDKGLNVRETFPLLSNQGRLNSQFRQASRGCLSRAALRDIRSPPQRTNNRALPGSSPPAGGGGDGGGGFGGKANKGFGNGPEGDDGNSKGESKNPGKGCGGPHSC
jgi:hypothetical protein